MDLKGKNALVGGASKGIGKAIAKELALLGANVTLVARSTKLLEQVKNELDSTQEQKHDVLVLDYSQPDELKSRLHQYLTDTNKVFHILVNNTGGPAGGHAIQAGIDEYRAAFEQHLICNQILLQSLVIGMKDSGYGRIINIISTSVKQPLENLGVSNTVRGAVANWSKTLANELGQYGITVNNVLPGATATERLHEIVRNKAKKTAKGDQTIMEEMQSNIPLGRFAEPEEIAAAVAFLASPAASYINGINVPVDGGRTSSL